MTSLKLWKKCMRPNKVCTWEPDIVQRKENQSRVPLQCCRITQSGKNSSYTMLLLRAALELPETFCSAKHNMITKPEYVWYIRVANTGPDGIFWEKQVTCGSPLKNCGKSRPNFKFKNSRVDIQENDESKLRCTNYEELGHFSMKWNKLKYFVKNVHWFTTKLVWLQIEFDTNPVNRQDQFEWRKNKKLFLNQITKFHFRRWTW